jgi:hypothetical protein
MSVRVVDKRIPPSIAPLLAAYLDGLDALPVRCTGVYVYGSIPLGDFAERWSDIDMVAVTERAWSEAEVGELAAMHARLAREYPLAERLAVMYVPLADLGKPNADIGSYPYTADGEFHPAGHFDLNAVTWWLLKHQGIALRGPAPATLPFSVAWADVCEAMRYNLETYWAGHVPHAARLARNDYAVLYAVSTLCRILTTLEEGEIISKTQAMDRWRDRLPAPLARLVAEAARIRHEPDAPSLYPTPDDRGADAVAFFAYVFERGAQTLAFPAQSIPNSDH